MTETIEQVVGDRNEKASQAPEVKIVVLERGFVYVGRVTIQVDGWLRIEEARNLRYWGTTNGLGQLALEGPTSSTKMDACGTVLAPGNAVVHLMLCNPAKW